MNKRRNSAVLQIELLFFHHSNLFSFLGSLQYNFNFEIFLFIQSSSHVVSSCSEKETLTLTSADLWTQELGLSTTESLQPYYNYTITVVAVNERGKGHPVEKMETTLEEGI